MPGERAQALALRERNPRAVTLVDTRSIFEAAAVIQRVDLLVSLDTALVHVAAAVGTPVVGLYPRDLRNRRLYAPYGVPSQLLGSDCMTLDSIQPRQVYQAVGELLRDSP